MLVFDSPSDPNLFVLFDDPAELHAPYGDYMDDVPPENICSWGAYVPERRFDITGFVEQYDADHDLADEVVTTLPRRRATRLPKMIATIAGEVAAPVTPEEITEATERAAEPEFGFERPTWRRHTDKEEYSPDDNHGSRKPYKPRDRKVLARPS